MIMVSGSGGQPFREIGLFASWRMWLGLLGDLGVDPNPDIWCYPIVTQLLMKDRSLCGNGLECYCCWWNSSFY